MNGVSCVTSIPVHFHMFSHTVHILKGISKFHILCPSFSCVSYVPYLRGFQSHILNICILHTQRKVHLQPEPHFQQQNFFHPLIYQQDDWWNHVYFIACPNRACYYKLRICLCICFSRSLNLRNQWIRVLEHSRTFYRNSLKSFFSD